MMPNPSAPSSPPAPPARRSPAERLRAARLARGLSQFTLAARAGLSLQTVGLAERAGIITGATAAKLAAVLGIAPEDLR